MAAFWLWGSGSNLAKIDLSGVWFLDVVGAEGGMPAGGTIGKCLKPIPSFVSEIN